MYERTWHGVDLTRLPAAAAAQDKPAGAEFYAQFYQALAAGGGAIAPAWARGKEQLGRLIFDRILQPWREEHQRAPSILALAAGKALVERVWLERGCPVTFHDCQAESLAEVRQAYPEADCLIGDLRELRQTRQYDVIAMITVEYVFTQPEFVDCLRTLKQWLRPGGRIILYTANALSVRRILAETVKRILGHYRRRPHVFWGYWRTPVEYLRAAQEAGLVTRDVYHFGGPQGLAAASAGSQRCPTWRQPNLIFELGIPPSAASK